MIFFLTFRAVPRNIKSRECHGCGSLPELVLKPAQGLAIRAGFFLPLQQFVEKSKHVYNQLSKHDAKHQPLVSRHTHCLPIQRIGRPPPYAVAFPATVIL